MTIIDDIRLLRMHLVANAGITALVGTDPGARVWGNRQDPPEGYRPADGAGIVFFRRGGPGTDEGGATVRYSYTFKCYGADNLAADLLYRALAAALDRAASGTIVIGTQEAPGTVLIEPGTLWVYSRSNFAVMFRVTA